MNKNPEFKFPDYIYVDYYMNLSPKKGNIKTLSYVLKKETEEEHYIDDVMTLYKMSGIDFKHDLKQFMDCYDEVIVGYWPARGIPQLVTDNQWLKWNKSAAYKIIGRNVANPNRVYINKKTKATLAKREKMAADVPMILKVTNNCLTLDKKLLLDYINKELQKKGYTELSQKMLVNVD